MSSRAFGRQRFDTPALTEARPRVPLHPRKPMPPARRARVTPPRTTLYRQPLYVRGQRNMTVYSATRRHALGQRRNAPLARDIAASGAFSQRVAGVGFEPM